MHPVLLNFANFAAALVDHGLKSGQSHAPGEALLLTRVFNFTAEFSYPKQSRKRAYTVARRRFFPVAFLISAPNHRDHVRVDSSIGIGSTDNFAFLSGRDAWQRFIFHDLNWRKVGIYDSLEQGEQEETRELLERIDPKAECKISIDEIVDWPSKGIGDRIVNRLNRNVASRDSSLNAYERIEKKKRLEEPDDFMKQTTRSLKTDFHFPMGVIVPVRYVDEKGQPASDTNLNVKPQITSFQGRTLLDPRPAAPGATP